ncbi:MAG: hypothetical protein RJQ00_12505 [Vicingaceae bacterium]
MKKSSLPLFIMLLAFASTSCKKEVSPEIEITVVKENGTPQGDAIVKTSIEGAEGGIINAEVIAEERTDQFGKAYFKFDNTVLVDVAVYRGNEIVDSTSILAETKRQRPREDNVYERTLIWR